MAVEPPRPEDDDRTVDDHAEAARFTRLKAAREALAFLDLPALASVARDALDTLAAKAGEGNGTALWLFAEIAHRACHELSRLTKANPRALEPVARRKMRWPLMRSHNPRLSDPDKRLAEIGLAKDAPFRGDQHSKWKPDIAAELAAALIRWLRSEYPPEPPLDRDHAAHWWRIARRGFLRSFPDPLKVPEFAAIVKTPTRRMSPGRWREGILSMIRARFEAMLPSQS